MSQSSITKVLNDFNKTNNISSDVDIQKICQVLLKYQQLRYIGRGCQTICFYHPPSDNVIKCCAKRQHVTYSILASKQTLLSKMNDLVGQKFPILPILDVIYDSQNWIVYIQPKCKILSSEWVDDRFICYLLSFIKLMVETNMMVFDIYYSNFGIYHNRIVLFDYHQIEPLSSTSNFLATNLYNLFVIYGQHHEMIPVQLNDNCLVHWDEIKNNNFGQQYFPQIIVTLIKVLYDRNKNEILKSLDITIDYFKKKILGHHYKLYKSLNFDENGIMHIDYPEDAYNIIFGYINEMKIQSIIDLHPIDHGLGLKLAQDFPDIRVTIVCQTEAEYIETQDISYKNMLLNLNIICADPKNLKCIRGDKYDMMLCNINCFTFSYSTISKYIILETSNVESELKFRTYLVDNKIYVEHFIRIKQNFMYVCRN